MVDKKSILVCDDTVQIFHRIDQNATGVSIAGNKIVDMDLDEQGIVLDMP